MTRTRRRVARAFRKGAPSEVEGQGQSREAFNRQFGGDAGAPAQAGSRAAVYKGEMGRNHKRAFNDLGGSSEGRSARGGRGRGCHKSRVADKAHLSAPIWVYALGIFDLHRRGSLVSYPMAQQYCVVCARKTSLRRNTPCSASNAVIQSDIDRLSTDEGIEDVTLREQLVGCRSGNR